MNIPGTLATIGFGALGYALGAIHATTAVANAYGLETTAARDASVGVVGPAATGVGLILIAAGLALCR